MKHMRRLILLGVYLSLLPCVLIIFCAYLYLVISFSKPKTTDNISSAVEFQALPDNIPQNTYVPSSKEARVEVLTEFFKRYDSPLLPFSQKIVDEADKYTIDWRLIPSIAMQESTLCLKAPKNSNNCWGFGIYGGKITRFDNYGQAIEIVTKTLAQEYKEKRGLEHPEEIVTRYTPGSTTWAEKVSYVMDRIQSNL